jgi:hypothetical protein
MISNLLYKLYWRLTINTWQIAFPDASIEDIAAGKPYSINIMKGAPADRWYADPFVLDVTPTHIVILAEEYLYSTSRGRIARLTIERSSFNLVQTDTVLDLDTHLSFPAIIRRGDKTYIYPENSASGMLNVYEYDSATNRCTLLGPMSDYPLVDAILTEIDGKEYIFATQKERANGDSTEVFAKNSNGLFEKVQTVTVGKNIGRNGGAFFSIGGKLLRPAQNCNGGYGRGLSIQQITKHGDRFEIKEERKIKSPRRFIDHGMHTLNGYKGVTVVDVSAYGHPAIGWLTDSIWKIFRLPTELK